MIAADQAALESRIGKQVMEMRVKEVEVFVKNFQVLGTNSTFLCGITFSCIYSKPTFMETVTTGDHLVGWRDFGSWQEVLLGLAAATSVGLNIIVMGVSAYVLIFGTELALRGWDRSMSKALDGMYMERRVLLRVYFGGVAATLVVAATLALAKFRSQVSAVVITLLIISGVLAFLFVRLHTRELFRFPTDISQKPGLLQLGGSYDPEVAITALEGGSVQQHVQQRIIRAHL